MLIVYQSRQSLSSYAGFFSRNEFKTTEIELNAMATAAKIGLKRIPKNGYKIPAAIGIKAEL